MNTKEKVNITLNKGTVALIKKRTDNVSEWINTLVQRALRSCPLCGTNHLTTKKKS